jgi:hypothetical protein
LPRRSFKLLSGIDIGYAAAVIETPTPLPLSLLHGVEAAISDALGIANVRHRSALHSLNIPDDVDLAATIYATIAANWQAGDADANKDRSRQNWRWTLQPQIGAENRSPEVVLERAIASACAAAGRTDWANQIPVASGLVLGASDGRRAIDLGQRRGEGHYELIELKIASDTPLFAAVELLGYASLWLLARKDPPATRPALLAAERIDLRVLAPAAFYASFDLRGLERRVGEGLAVLGNRQGLSLTFAYDVLPAALSAAALPVRDDLLHEVERRTALHSDQR